EMSNPAPPKPPSSSENSAPMAPSSANCSQISREKPVSDVAIWSRRAKSYCSEMKRSSVSANMRRSSVCSKFIVPSLQTQDHLGDDVLLDLVRAAENRQLAVVEIQGGRAGRLFRAHRLLVIAFVQRLFDERLGVRAHGTAGKGEDLLTDLGTADLEHGALGARHTATCHGCDDAQVGGLHVLEVYLDTSHACRKCRILRQRPAVALHLARDVLETLEAGNGK